MRESGVSTTELIAPLPATKVVRVGADGQPWIEGFRCAACGAAVSESTLCCRACGSRTSPEPFVSPMHGQLVTWSVIHRSFPGVAVPFVSAIVDLDGGLTLKGTLRGAHNEGLTVGLPVRVEFDDAGGAVDGEGVPYVGFHFLPAGDRT